MLIDISPVVDASTPVWPGDVEFSMAPTWQIAAGDSVTVNEVRTTTHIGAHIDAPSHIVDGAPSIAELPLDAFVGACVVVDVSDLVDRSVAPNRPALVHAVRERLEALVGGEPIERLLLRHTPHDSERAWDAEMPGIDQALITWLGEQGGKLIGIDLASFDPEQSSELLAHRAAISHNIVMLEGLDLSKAPIGVSELIALPLPWRGADASPVRAVLRTSPGEGDASQTNHQ